MRRKILYFLIATVILVISAVPASASTPDDVENYLISVLGEDKVSFEINEINYLSGEKSLDISRTVIAELETEEYLNIMEEIRNSYIDMMNEEWFDYNSIIDNICVGNHISATTLYKPDDEYSVCTAWCENGLEYRDFDTGQIKNHDPMLEDKVSSYEENIPYHMYQIAQDIVNSNFNTYCIYPEYYSKWQDDVHITYNESMGEVAGTANVDNETYMYCVQFSYESKGGGNYSYDMSYGFIEGIGTSGVYVPMK